MIKQTNTSTSRRRRRRSVFNTKLLEASREVSSMSEFFVMMQYETTTAAAYCGVLSKCRRQESPGLKTMAVTIAKDGGYILLYDPSFNDMVRDSQNWDTVRNILIHEFVHLQDEHVPRTIQKYQLETDKEVFGKINPLAVDFACNSTCIDWDHFTLDTLLSSKPHMLNEDGSIMKDTLDRPIGKWRGVYPTEEPWNLPKDLSYERYYKILKDILEDKPPKEWKGKGKGKKGEGKGEGSSQDPCSGDKKEESGSGEMSTEERLEKCKEILNAPQGQKMFIHIEDLNIEDLTEEQLEAIMQESEKIAAELNSELLSELKSRGLGSGRLAQELISRLAPPQIPWEQFLRNFVKRASLKKNKKKSIRHQNKRRGGNEDDGWSLFPGKVDNPKVKLLVAFDTSASVSDAEFNAVRNEVLKLHSLLGEVTVIYCDTVIEHIEKLTANSKLPTKVWGRGGTSFEPPFQWAKETRFNPDIIIYGTDGECPLPPKHLRINVPMLWVITPQGCLPGQWGSHREHIQTGKLHHCEYGSAIKLGKV